MTPPKEQVKKKNISLYPREWGIVEQVERRYSLSTSAAIRHIVNQWQEMRYQLPLPLQEQS